MPDVTKCTMQVIVSPWGKIPEANDRWAATRAWLVLWGCCGVDTLSVLTLSAGRSGAGTTAKRLRGRRRVGGEAGHTRLTG